MSFLCREQIKSFHFTRCFFDEETKTAHLLYAFNEGAIEFEEKIRFCEAPSIPDPARRQVLEICLRLLHLAAGVSYYKLFVPDEIKVDCTRLSKREADFFNLFYTAGLGEFSYRNNVALNIRFPFDADRTDDSVASITLKKRIVVPVGGGKDSIVSIEALKSSSFSPILFSVGLPRPIKETIEISGLPSILVQRHLSDQLIKINECSNKYHALNGHVPVTGIIAFILMVAAVLYDFSAAALSNERSANVGNTEKDGRAINHQWSKSLEFERAFDSLKSLILPEFHYFSLLRPLSELTIASLFAKTKKYDFVFTSCNKAFKLDENKRLDRWCANCDKCRFVFLALAPFMDKEKLIRIFGRNMLNDLSQLQGYKELLGLSAFKPFECVGEIEESVLAFLMLSDSPQWRDEAVIKTLSNDVYLHYKEKKTEFMKRIFSSSSDHLIPEEYANVIGNFKKQTCHSVGERY